MEYDFISRPSGQNLLRLSAFILPVAYEPKAVIFIMSIGFIHSIESMGLVDGPGIRTVVFMQGCNLRCIYCHNPDTWEICRAEPKAGCSQISSPASKYTPNDLIKKLIRFKPYYGVDGGVTFSGGEPLLQSDFLIECLKLCRENGINTCIDTAGCGTGKYDDILRYTDLVLLDVKHCSPEKYRSITGKNPGEYEKFLECVQKNDVPLWIRHVVVPGLTDGDAHLCELEAYLKKIKNIVRVELLPYHTLGVDKYKKMGIPYKLEGVAPLSPAAVEKWNDRLNRSCVSKAKQ